MVHRLDLSFSIIIILDLSDVCENPFATVRKCGFARRETRSS